MIRVAPVMSRQIPTVVIIDFITSSLWFLVCARARSSARWLFVPSRTAERKTQPDFCHRANACRQCYPSDSLPGVSGKHPPPEGFFPHDVRVLDCEAVAQSWTVGLCRNADFQSATLRMEVDARASDICRL